MIDPLDTAPLRAAMQPIPTGMRTPLAKALIAAYHRGDTPEATVRRAMQALDTRVLRAERRHGSDREAEALADIIEQHADLCLAIARWAGSWKAVA